MDDILTNLEKMYNSGNTWAEALALVGAFVTLYLLRRIKDMKVAEAHDNTLKQKAVDQATNRTDNQAIEDKMQAGSIQVEDVLDELDAELSAGTPPPDPKTPKGSN